MIATFIVRIAKVTKHIVLIRKRHTITNVIQVLAIIEAICGAVSLIGKIGDC